MMLKLQKYDVTVVHRPGKDIPVADTLSRKFLQNSDSSIGDFTDIMVHSVAANLPISDVHLKELQDALNKDSQMQALSDTRKKCPTHIQEYWNHRDELTTMCGLIFHGDRLVIPEVLRGNMLQQIYHGHMGMDKCKARARDILFWPGMYKQIEEVVSKCTVCTQTRRVNTKELIIPQPLSDRP